MKVKLILPSLSEAKSPLWRPIKYSLFPPLGLATLAAYLDANDQIELQGQHVEKLNLDDEPDLVIVQVLSNLEFMSLYGEYHCQMKCTDWL